jgi:hypothetical protein
VPPPFYQFHQFLFEAGPISLLTAKRNSPHGVTTEGLRLGVQKIARSEDREGILELFCKRSIYISVKRDELIFARD